MAYLGRQGVTAPLTSADIPDNSITTAKIVDSNITTAKILDDNVTAAKIPAGAVSSDVLYLENATAAQELSGTFATGTERLYFNDLYTLTGDLTIQENAHLALGTIADKDVLIEADTGSTERKITGEGTLDSGNVLQDTHRTSLTDMTGELGSAVTQATGYTLGSGVDFDTAFPFSESAQNIGKLRIVVINIASIVAAVDYGAAYNPRYVSKNFIDYSGFASTPKIFAQYTGTYHDAVTGRATATSVTGGYFYITCNRSAVDGSATALVIGEAA
jgi:hypothetical protein